MIDLKLPMTVYKVGNASFSPEQIEAMIARTNSKLAVAGIEIEILDVRHVERATPSYVFQNSTQGAIEHSELVKNCPAAAGGRLRLFLVKVNVDEHHGSWTYEPLGQGLEEFWRGAVFISEMFNDNRDVIYSTLEYPASSDSLLHELGHVLLQETDHYQGPEDNFFHETSSKLDDSILPTQIERMRDMNSLGPSTYLIRR